MMDQMGGDRPITIQDVVFRFYLNYFMLLQAISFETDRMGFARAARNAYLMIDGLYSTVCYYMDEEGDKEYREVGSKYRALYRRIEEDAKANVLVSQSTDKINNLYLRLANDRLRIISRSLGKRGILKEHRAAAMSGEHLVKIGPEGQILSDGDPDTYDDSDIGVENPQDVSFEEFIDGMDDTNAETDQS